jgi:protein SCO1
MRYSAQALVRLSCIPKGIGLMQHPHRRAGTPLARTFHRGAAWLLAASLAFCLSACGGKPQNWQLENVEGHLPDLSFSLTSDSGTPMSAQDLKGKIAIVYFGYTHCPDICPETMAKLSQALAKSAASARDMRIVFISVDPTRDTPAAMHAYVDAFDARHAIGLTGTPSEIETIAKRYRVAYQADQPEGTGSYEVSHSSGIYIFDRDGKARLLANGNATVDQLAHDLQQLAQPS